jgi:hypothetical protein
LATGYAGDEGDFAVESSHSLLLVGAIRKAAMIANF